MVNAIGKKGEEIAAAYLQKKGYKVLETNFQKQYREVDIITIHQNTLVFIEVKTRTSGQFGTPFESITSWKLKSIIQTAQFYTSSYKNLPEALRIAAISIKLFANGEVESIEHMENISG